MTLKAFKKIGRRLFFGFALIYLVTLVAGGTELIVRRKVVSNYELLEKIVNRLENVVVEIVNLTGQVAIPPGTPSTAEAERWAQEILQIQSQLQAKYEVASQLAGDDPKALELLQTAKEQSTRWIAAMLASLGTAKTVRRNATPLSSDSANLPAEINETYTRLIEHIRTRHQEFAGQIHALSKYADGFLMIVLLWALLFTAVMSVWIPHTLGKRINTLVQASKDLEAGQYVPGSKEYPEDEFGDVAKAFDTMATALGEKEEQLQQSLDQLESINKNLETIVEERTGELRNAQDELIKKERLSMLGTLSGAIGHELRNPLSVMSTSLYFLERTVPTTDDKVKKHLAMLLHQISASNRIITNLLDFARTKEPLCEETDLNELIQEAIRRSIIPRTVQLNLSLSDRPAVAMVDSTQINQVVMNLIANAVQAMSRGGQLTVDVGRSDELIDITVADTGCGISEENRSKIFQPLFSTKPKGVGLGLAVSKKIVETNRGQIAFDSEPGVGTRFRVCFPALKLDSTDSRDFVIASRQLASVGEEDS
jgi:signal transduction histidine kinase